MKRPAVIVFVIGFTCACSPQENIVAYFVDEHRDGDIEDADVVDADRRDADPEIFPDSEIEDSEVEDADPDGDEAPVVCDIHVPGDFATISEAITNTIGPATICIGAGNFSENLWLKPQVSLRGAGQRQTTIEGLLSIAELASDDKTPTVVSDLVFGGVSCCPRDHPDCISCGTHDETPIVLVLERVFIEKAAYPFEPFSAFTCIDARFDYSIRGPLSITLRDSLCQGRILSPHIPDDAGVELEWVIERVRFHPEPIDSTLYSLLWLGTRGETDCGDPHHESVQVRIHIENNDFYRVVTPIRIDQCFDIAHDKSSYIRIAHNTFFGTVTGEFALENRINVAEHGPSIILANNLFSMEYADAVLDAGEPSVDVGNLFVSDESFFDLGCGDLRLTTDSPAIDRAEPSYAPETDIDSVARPLDGDNDGKASPDIGSHEYHPDQVPLDDELCRKK